MTDDTQPPDALDFDLPEATRRSRTTVMVAFAALVVLIAGGFAFGYLQHHDVAIPAADGTAATPQQEAADVTTFLAWAADPNLDTRREIGLRAILFLVFLTVIAIASKRRVWREVV